MVKGKDDANSHANSLNPLCGTCKLSIGDASSQTVLPGDSADYEFRAENTGDCDDGTLTLTPTSQRGWGTDVTAPSLPASLQPGDWVTVTLVHTVPTCELSGTVDVVTVTAILDCTSCGNSDEKATTLTTTVKRAYGVDLSPNISKTAAASETVPFTHTLSNTGNYTDVFSFDATSTLSSSIVPPPTTPVGPFSSTIIPVTVVVSPSAEKDQVDTIVITAISMSDPNTSDYVIDQIEVITSGCEVELNISEPVQRVTPGESVTYTLTVSNVGACTGTVGIETDTPEDWSIDIAPPPTNTLPPGGSADWLVSLSVPLCKPPADKTTGITVVLTCTAIGTAADPENVTTTIVSRTAAAIEPGVIKIISLTETEAIFTHTVTNTGNLTDTFDFPVHSAQRWSVRGPSSEELGTCASKPITFSVSIPSDAPIISDTIVITAVPRHAPNQHDTATDGIRADCDIRLNVNEPIQSAIPGESVTYTLTVSNVGTHTSTAGIETDAPEDWSINITLPPTNTLPPGGSAEWLVSLTVPLCESSADKTTGITALLTCTAISKTVTTPGNITTTVLSTPIAAIEPGVVKTIPVTEDIISDGAMVTFTHTVTNTGSRADIFTFTVHSAQGWTVTVPSSDTWGICISKPVTFSVTIPQNVTIVSDTLVITAIPQLAADNRATATDGIEDGRVFLPIVMKNFCEGTPLCNGDFKAGNLSCWSHSHYGVDNELPVLTVPDPSGGYRALLGYPTFYCRGAVPTGRAWMEQTFKVPNYGNPTITFTYEMHTQHTIDYDTFEVYLNGHQILELGHPGPKSGCDEPPIVIPGMCTITLTNPTTDCNGNSISANFPCTDVTLRFENWNRRHNYYNTWTYVDDIEFTWSRP